MISKHEIESPANKRAASQDEQDSDEDNQLVNNRTKCSTTAICTQAVSSSDEVSQNSEQEKAPITVASVYENGLFAVVWPEQDILDLPVISQGKQIKLMSYRWPAANNNGQRKGVVFILHGYGQNAPRLAIQAKSLAQAGYEVFGMDMRGFGNSGGGRAVVEAN